MEKRRTKSNGHSIKEATHMNIYYDGWGGYLIGDYYINESSGRWEIRSNLDNAPEYTTETFQEAVDWCLDKER